MDQNVDADKPCIEAIQTCYNGFFFRSRSEARWAVLFDLLKIKYHYEIEGYKLSSGDWYLPDFYLPVVNLWAEVKPFAPTVEEGVKCILLAADTGRGCLMLAGPPDFRTYLCHRPDLSTVDALLDIDYHGRKYYDQEHRLFSGAGGYFDCESDFSQEYRLAVSLSRAKRFKHWEPPAPGYEPFNPPLKGDR